MENNYIISELYITKAKRHKRVRIINSFENCKKERGWNDKEADYKYKNEEEIKKCKIIINGKIIPFSYYYIFEKVGKYNIKYLFSENLTRATCMFCRCNSLTKIDLSNFNTQNITDMSDMFYGCNSLIKKTINFIKGENYYEDGENSSDEENNY